jgi:pimeloyl-ACP methyl ester carboxylesterase
MMTGSRRIALLAAAIYLFVIFSGRLADRLILFPSTAPINPGSAIRQSIPFQAGELEIWTAASHRARQNNKIDAYILRFYGNADRAELWAALEVETWNDRAVEVWAVNYPGFGGSSGPARLKQIPSAALAAFDALQSKAGTRPIIVFGTSLGATVALHVAAHRAVHGIVLHNPPPLRQIILRHFGWWNLWVLAGPVALELPRELDSLENAMRTQAPGLFILAERDEIVPPKFQRLVFDAFAGEKRMINLPGAYHNSPIEGTIMADVYRAYDWLLPR